MRDCRSALGATGAAKPAPSVRVNIIGEERKGNGISLIRQIQKGGAAHASQNFREYCFFPRSGGHVISKALQLSNLRENSRNSEDNI